MMQENADESNIYLGKQTSNEWCTQLVTGWELTLGGGWKGKGNRCLLNHG